MELERKPRHAAELAIALAIGVVVSCLVALAIVHWADRHQRVALRKESIAPSEERVEIRFDEPEQGETSEPDVIAEVEQADAVPNEPIRASVAARDIPDPQPSVATPEEEEIVPEPAAVLVQPEPSQSRASVDQPTTNETVPDTEDYFLAEVDNQADEQTTSERAVNELENVETVEQTAPSERDEPEPEVGAGTGSDPNEVAESGEVDPAETGDDQRAEDVLGAESESRASLSEEGAPAQAEDEGAEAQSAEAGETVPLREDGVLDAGEGGATGETSLSASDRMAQVFEGAAGAGSAGTGASSVTRDGAVAAHASFDQLFGNRTAVGRERLRAERRREGIAGDHQHDWERTREALENHDILVATGEETHLNTRRSAHAGFINQYHNRIHGQWRSFTNSLASGGSGNQAARDLSLKTVVDIRVMADGEVERVRIRQSSGSTYFDAEAVRVHLAVGIAPAPPSEIVCSDGAVYIRWIMSRNVEGCGTFNATLHCPG